ncbi:MAG: glutaredoxin domain-containing protein [Myxococcota bacterium]
MMTIAAGGCQQRTSTAAQDTDVVSTPPTIQVTPSRKDLIFTYQDPDSGKFTTAADSAEVPQKARRSVVVTDLSLSPEQRQAGRYVYITDLRRVRKDGTYPVAVASRYGFEARLTDTSSTAATSKREVVVYSASWCGVCKTTKKLLKKWRVPFVDKDVEASRLAQQELAQKAAQAGVRPGGVPVIDVAGILLQGLDEQQLRSALKQRGFL